MLESLKRINEEEYKFDTIAKVGNYFFVFLIGSFAGYIYEFLFYLLIDHKLVNSGFLYGPYIPVYGTGAVLMLFLLKRFKKHPVLVFLLAMIVTGVLEYVTGVFMYELYHRRWWDYTGLFLNINGYVCLRSVLTFGIGGLLLIYIVDPVVCSISTKFDSHKYLMTASCGIFIMVLDLALTLMFRNKL